MANRQQSTFIVVSACFATSRRIDKNVLMKIEGVLNHETQSDSQRGSAGHLNVRLCSFRRAPALQQLEPVKLNAQQRPETEKQKRKEERQKAGPASGTNRLLHLWMTSAGQGGSSGDKELQHCRQTLMTVHA
jgi:hypothetical protein